MNAFRPCTVASPLETEVRVPNNSTIEDGWQPVRAARDYRTFLKAYLEVRDLNLADLARAAGFGRGFPGDVISGKRRLTAKSFYAFEKGMKLPASGRKLFRLLVAREESDLFPDVARESLETMIEALRKKPWSGTRRMAKEADSRSFALFEDYRVALIYAASGQPGRGASLEELKKRTSLGSAELLSVTQRMTTAGLLVKAESEDRWEPQDLHLFLQSGHQKSGDQNELLTTLFRRGCRAASERVAKGASSSSEMFFSSALCVHEEKLPQLKAALRETMLKFVDDSIEAEGDRVVQLLCSLHL